MKLDPNMAGPDDFYAALIKANEGLTQDQSHQLMFRLVFLLANQIGDSEVLAACVAESAKLFQSGKKA